VSRKADALALSRSYRLVPVDPCPPGGDALRPAADWLIELAWDGHRVLVARDGKDVRLTSSDFREWSATFPAVSQALRRLAGQRLVADGFVCAMDERGRPSFERLRSLVRGKAPGPVVLALWDLLFLDGEDLAGLPLGRRRERLAALLENAADALVLSEPIGAGDVADVVAPVAEMGLRGVVARRRDGTWPPPVPWLGLPCGDTPLAWDRSLSPPPAVSNADKVLYPRDGFTKQDVVGYYAAVAPVMLPYLRDRPVVCQRWPDGIDDFTWYQHRPPPRAPDYLRGVWKGRERRILIENADALGWMANQATVTFHGWTSRATTADAPDWAFLDLDPGADTRWETTIEVSLALRQLLELLELPSVVKTSGQKGLHVLVPLPPGHTATQAQDLALGMARMVERLMPDVVSLDAAPARRRGRLLLDHLQAFRGKSLVLPYALRAADGAPASTPLDWSEVTPRLDPRAFNLRTMRARLDARGDLAAPLLAAGVPIQVALARLADCGGKPTHPGR
jgi:bifunctional non-homologous end joining protein LigD